MPLSRGLQRAFCMFFLHFAAQIFAITVMPAALREPPSAVVGMQCTCGVGQTKRGLNPAWKLLLHAIFNDGQFWLPAAAAVSL